MTITQTPDQSQVIKVLLHYKKFYLSLLIICICITLLIVIIIPQFQQYGQQQSEIAQVKERMRVLQNNISFLSQVNQEQQNTQLSAVMGALPDDKDYAGILFAVRSASAKAGVGLGDFTFQVGELSQKSVITRNLPTISLELHVLGSPTAVGKFLEELSQTTPLSNITEVIMSGNSSEIITEFYYKPVPQLQINYAQPIEEIGQKNREILDLVQKWDTAEPVFDSLQPLESSSSATPFGL